MATTSTLPQQQDDATPQQETSIQELTDEQLLNYFDNCLKREANSEKYIFYPDHDMKWGQDTNAEGYQLLIQLLKITHKMMKSCEQEMSKLGLNVAEEVKKGRETYSKKPNKKQGAVETWSKEEYQQLSLQHAYLRYKSFQRFTETYAMLERLHEFGIFDNLPAKVRMVSIGGGPGFELYAVRIYFSKHFPHVNLECTSQDLEAGWGPFAKELGCAFVQGSFYDESLIQQLANDHDYVLLSYVVYHYMSDKANLLADMLYKTKTKAVFANERFEDMSVMDKLEQSHNVKVVRLIDQRLGRDDRQVILRRKNTIVFPNIPYEEHKKKRKREDSEYKPRKHQRNDYDDRSHHRRRDYSPKDSSSHHHRHYDNNKYKK